MPVVGEIHTWVQTHFMTAVLAPGLKTRSARQPLWEPILGDFAVSKVPPAGHDATRSMISGTKPCFRSARRVRDLRLGTNNQNA